MYIYIYIHVLIQRNSYVWIFYVICSGATGHVEVYDCDILGDENTYRDLVKFFFQFHDPTTLNKQGMVYMYMKI